MSKTTAELDRDIAEALSRPAGSVAAPRTPLYGHTSESSCLIDNDFYTAPPEWAFPDPVSRHVAMVDAFLAFAPDAKFGAS
jgi:hypothetical protein